MSVGDVTDAAFNAYSAATRLAAYVGMNEEVKFVDTTKASAAVTNAGVITPISLLAEGSTSSTRDGESIRAHGLELKWQSIYNGVPGYNLTRFLVIADAECRGAAPAVADVLESTGAVTSVLSPWNHLGAPRFDILFDSGVLPQSTGHNGILARECVIPLKHHVRYNGAAGAIGQSYEGTLFVVEIADSAANGPSTSWYSRLHFIDN
jgi:hypothetical protein